MKSAMRAAAVAALAAAALGLMAPASAQMSFFSEIARECEGVYREGLSFRLKTDLVKEASGLAASRKHPNVFWTHNDGTPNKLYAMTNNPGQEGLLVSSLELPDFVRPITNQGDWEDISSAECPDGSGRVCIWVADIGDNALERDSYFVYAVVEPAVNPVVVFNDPLEDDSPMGRKLQQLISRRPAQRRSSGYLDWMINQTRSGRGVGNDAHERFNRAVRDQEHYNYNGDLREEYKDVPLGPDGKPIPQRTCDVDHKYLIDNLADPRDVWVFEVKTPAGDAMNSEAFAVAPDGSKFWIIEKTNEASARVFESSSLQVAPEEANSIVRKVALNQIDVLSPPCFTAGVGCPDDRMLWSITGMDVHPMGNRVVVQTYKGPFEYTLPTPFDLSMLSTVTPKGGVTDKGAEAVAYSLDGMTLWQIPEDADDVGCQVMQPAMCTFTATQLP